MEHNSVPHWQANSGSPAPRSSTSTSTNVGFATTTSFLPRGRVKIINIDRHSGAMTRVVETATGLETSSLYGSIAGSSFLQPPVHQEQRFLLPQQQTTTMLNESILLQTADGREYLVDESSIQNIDQIPPENLIYVATSASTLPSAGGESLVTDEIIHMPADPPPMDHYDKPAMEVQSEHPQYAEECEVTEEVITDDWVQSQGEECVQVTVDQLGGSTIAVVEDDIPVPLDQDQYTLSRPYPCDFCSRRFRKKASLQNHLMAHSNDRPHVCNLCGAQYGRRWDLINHLKQHAYTSSEQDELSLRGVDQDGDDYLSEVGQTSYHTKHRQRHSSDDDDMYTPDTMVSYNSLPPMQLISTSNSASFDADDPMARASPFSNGLATVDSSVDTSFLNPPANASASGRRTKASSSKSGAAVRPTSRTPRSVRVPNRYIKKEPVESVSVTGAMHPSLPATGDRKSYVCSHCGASFARAKGLATHMRCHVGDELLECDYCFQRFLTRTLLQDHIRRVHFCRTDSTIGDDRKKHGLKDPQSAAVNSSNGRYKCDRCNECFLQLEDVENHIRQAHGSELMKFQFASAIVKQEHPEPSSSLKARHSGTPGDEIDEVGSTKFTYSVKSYANRSGHNAPAEDATPMTCGDCGETFEHALDLLEHTDLHGRNDPHECQLCGEKFIEEANIKQHIQERHRSQLTPTSCSTCGKRCKSQNTLIKHSFDHSRDRAFCCSQCGKTFHHMARLKRHMESHRSKSVRCEVCSQEFPDGRTLMNHRHSHSKTSEFPCYECGKSFGSRSSQQIHMRIHTGERPYGCRFCWKAFADGGTLRKHERIHTGEKPYACPVCPKAFNQRVVLREHIRAHHSQADTKRTTDGHQFHCIVCNTSYATTGDLVQHLIEHSDTNTAMQRKPPTFPRKYKRRRKLKPHELERLQNGRRKHKEKRTTDDDGTEEEPPLEEARDQFLEYDVSDGPLDAPTTRSVPGGSMNDQKGDPHHGILDDNGINLLSNVVFLHEQNESMKLNKSKVPESLRKPPVAANRAKRSAGPGSSRMVHTPQTKKPPARKTANVAATSTRKRTVSSTRHDTAKDVPATEDEKRDSMSNVIEAFYELERNRGRHRNSMMPSYVREIPSHRISSVSFPLLDDGNTDDPLEEPHLDDVQSTIGGKRPHASRETAPQLETLPKGKQRERFNSDTLNDLQEILSAPIKGEPSAISTAKAQNSNAVVKNKSKAQQKKASSAGTARARKVTETTSNISRSATREPPQTVLRSQRLTRRQLEREVNFLKEAFSFEEPADASAQASTVGTARSTTSSIACVGDAKSKETSQPEQGGATEQLAAMLLNDGMPDNPGNSGGSRRSSNSSTHGGGGNDPYAEDVYMKVKQEYEEQSDDGDENMAYTTSPYRCSICAACFEDRSQLILHVPVHI